MAAAMEIIGAGACDDVDDGAAPGTIVPATVMLLGGQVLPFALLTASAWMTPMEMSLALVAAMLAYVPRIVSAVRFRQSAFGVILHPVGVLLLVAIQWFALTRRLVGRPATWKGRRYQPVKA